MKRAFSLLVLVAAVSAFSASAASLRVDAGVLQVWHFAVDLCRDHPELCVPPEGPDDIYTLEVEVWRMDGNSGKREGIDAPTHRFQLPAGASYLISWSEANSDRTCHRSGQGQGGGGGSEHAPPGTLHGFGEFDAGSDVVRHVVCVQDGHTGEPVVRIVGGDVVSPLSGPEASALSTTSSATTEGPDEPAPSSEVAESEPAGGTDEVHVGPDDELSGAE
jgi:hypothetical protein